MEVANVLLDTSELYGIYRTLQSIPYDNIVIVIDGIPTRSNTILSSYKGNRSKDDTSEGYTISQKDIIKSLTCASELLKKSIHVVCSPCQETDEVISSIVHEAVSLLPNNHIFIDKLNSKSFKDDRCLKKYDDASKTKFHVEPGSKIVIASTDGDFIQLQRYPNVYIDTSMTGKEVSNTRSSKSTCGLTPIQTIMYKAIFGDSSDNIPAVYLSSKQKKEVLDLISSVKSEEDLETILNSIMTSPKTEIETLLFSQRKTIRTNLQVTQLKFVSFPYELHYNFDTKAYINKYKVRIRCYKD